jgi:hypothetical protein
LGRFNPVLGAQIIQQELLVVLEVLVLVMEEMMVKRVNMNHLSLR